MLDRSMNAYHNAKKFIYEYLLDADLQSIGAHIYLLRTLQNRQLITFNDGLDTASFIAKYKDQIEKFDVADCIDESTYEFDIEKYFKTIFSEKPHCSDVKFTQFSPEKFIDTSARLSDKNDLSTRAGIALLNETNLLPGRISLHQRRDELRKDKLDEPHITQKVWGISKESTWPFTKVGNCPLYAASGFSEDKETMRRAYGTEFEAAWFFDELAKNEIQYIVALGKIGADFPGYFKEEKTYTSNWNNQELVVKIKPQSINTDNQPEYVTYQFEYTYTLTDLKNNVTTTKSSAVTLLHVSIDDAQSIDYDEKLDSFYDTLLLALRNNKNVAVHCKAGAGRTGQLVATLMLLLQRGKMEYIFEEDDVKTIAIRIKEFVDELRQYRAGFMLEEGQLFEFLVNAYEYASKNYENSLSHNEDSEVSNDNNDHFQENSNKKRGNEQITRGKEGKEEEEEEEEDNKYNASKRLYVANPSQLFTPSNTSSVPLSTTNPIGNSENTEMKPQPKP